MWGIIKAIVMDGKVYHQTSGIFNMLYNYDKSLFTNFTKKTAEKYEQCLVAVLYHLQ